MRKATGIIAVAVLSSATSAFAINALPDLADVPTGWTTDRYEPTSFSNIGTSEGRDNVLGIEVDSAGNPGGLFYQTEGRKHAVVGGAGDSLAADLFVEAAWEDESNGSVRTDIWGVMSDGLSITDYPIIGFSNYGGIARFRVWDDVDWVDLASTVLFGEWNSLSLLFTGSEYEYYVNGSLAYTDTTVNGSTEFQDVIMQAYDFGTIGDAVAAPYVAKWSNPQSSAVPDSGSSAIMLGALILGFIGLRNRRN